MVGEEKCEFALTDFGRLDTCKKYPELFFGTNCHCSFATYSINVVGSQNLNLDHMKLRRFVNWSIFNFRSISRMADICK